MQGDASPAAFEKALSKLSSQIEIASVQLDKTRTRQRYYKLWWTLYASIAQLVSLAICVLVIGPNQWDIREYAVCIGGPVLVYSVRKAIGVVFGWQISRQQTNVNRLQKQRDVKIEELKKATKFDSTQQLLQKYGARTPSAKQNDKKDIKKQKDTQSPVQRTGIPPPPTANIQRPSTHQQMTQAMPQTPPRSSGPQEIPLEPPGFAPNAFLQPPSVPSAYERTPKWYDRILDVMLGEDENLAKNRLALLCENCRLVNGQAPPGVKTLEEIGRWRCSGCSAWNGVESGNTRSVLPKAQMMSPEPADDPHEHEHEREHDESDTDHESAKQLKIADLEQDHKSTGSEISKSPSTSTQRVTRSTGRAEVQGL